ncbi:hypothetical protein MHYP_G00058010 [Metynnis hypsauchen]
MAQAKTNAGRRVLEVHNSSPGGLVFSTVWKSSHRVCLGYCRTAQLHDTRLNLHTEGDSLRRLCCPHLLLMVRYSCGPPISILALKDGSPGTIGAQAPGVKLQGLFKQPASMGGDQGLQQLP